MATKSYENPNIVGATLLTESRDIQKPMISTQSSFRLRGPQKVLQIMKRDDFQNVRNSLDSKLDKKSPKMFSLSPIITKKMEQD